uniref:Septin-type G domain-containing protein n=1 Tax=Knipowitschia caucasica TaxID=637954 RepID=A0AAV2MNC0_KNICA
MIRASTAAPQGARCLGSFPDFLPELLGSDSGERGERERPPLISKYFTVFHRRRHRHIDMSGEKGKMFQAGTADIRGKSNCDSQPAENLSWFPDATGYVGFANLPNQVHRKSVKKGFEFTLMVVGESGLGKSTLINSLFLTDLYPERYIPGAAEKIERTVQIEASTVEIEERGVKLRLTVVDTPGYGDAIDSQDCFKTIIQYIDNQFERYLHDESGLNRRHIVDNRVHCCFYFISPFGHGRV